MEKEKDVIEIIVDEPLRARADDGAKSDNSDLSARFVKISCAVCVGVLLIAFAAGLILSKSDGMITKQLEVMRERNDEYAQAKELNDSAVLENDNAKKRLEDKEKELDTLNQSQDNLNKLSSANEDLEKEKQSLENEIASKRRELAGLETSVADKTKRTITWSSGRYTVGENIAAGAYTVTGSGSISIGGSGKSRVNKSLKSDGETFTLSNGDVIQIDGSAKFVPQ